MLLPCECTLNFRLGLEFIKKCWVISTKHQLGQQYLSGGFGAVMSFEVRSPAAFLEALEVIRMAPNLGDTRTLAVHPWTTTHGRMPEAARRAAGVTPQSIRMSVGVEAASDLQADLAQALARSGIWAEQKDAAAVR